MRYAGDSLIINVEITYILKLLEGYDKTGKEIALLIMLSRLELLLSSSEELSYQMSSLFHGALMELLPLEYAERLHISQLHPYSQHLERRDKNWYWVINCINEEAADIIIHQILENTKQIVLKKKQIVVEIKEKSYTELSEKKMMGDFYREQSSRYIQVQFISPTAFKQNGQYIFYPDLRCIFQSLMNKYDAAAGENIMLDEDALLQLCDNASIIKYDLKSVTFSLEGVRIPSFIGNITIKMRGTQTMANLANLLFEFGEFSGVGIKTALGMGAVKRIEGREKDAYRQAD